MEPAENKVTLEGSDMGGLFYGLRRKKRGFLGHQLSSKPPLSHTEIDDCGC